jgi:hypothetical protein
MKKTTQSPRPKKETPSPGSTQAIKPHEEPPILDVPEDEGDLAADQLAVVNSEEEASSSGHRVEPIQEDDEHNAEKLIEEGLHGYLRASPNHPHKPR